MNNKLRILLCTLLSAIAIAALAFVGCEFNWAATSDSSNSTSESTTNSESPEDSSSTSDDSSSTSGDSTSDPGTAHEHTYAVNDPSEWEWEETETGYTVTVTIYCTGCDYTTPVSAEVTVTSTTEATCTTPGQIVYHASYLDYSIDYPVTIPATGHNYDTDKIEWEWADDYSSATAIVTCLNEGDDSEEHEFEATVAPSTLAEATCTTAGLIMYTATVTIDGNVHHTTESVTVPSNHSSGDTLTYHEAVAATESAHGSIGYWECSVCNNKYSDSSCTTLVTDVTTHYAEHAAFAIKNATTYTVEHWFCPVCDKYFSDEDCTTEITSDAANKEYTFSGTIYDASYLTGLTTGTITAGTSLFDGFATVNGFVAYYSNTNIPGYTNSVVDGYKFSYGRLYLGSSGTLTFTLSNDATLIVYTDISSNYSMTVTSTTDTTNTTTLNDANNLNKYVIGLEYELTAGTYTLSVSGTCNIFAIQVEGNDYSAGIWNYIEHEEEELGENQFKLEAGKEYTFTATTAGYYTFSVPEYSYVVIWKSEADYNNTTDYSITPYLESGATSFEVYIKENASITMYCFETVTVTYSVSETSSGSDIETDVPESLSVGNNNISLSSADSTGTISLTFTSTETDTCTFVFAITGNGYAEIGDLKLKVYEGLTQKVELEAGASVTVILYSYSNGSPSSYTLSISLYTADEGGSGETSGSFELETETDYMFTATVAGTYTFTLTAGDIDSAVIYEGEESYNNWGTALLDVQGDYSYSFSKTLAAGESITLYLSGSDGATVAWTVGESSGDEPAASVIPESLATDGTANEIYVSDDDAYDGAEYTFTASADGDYTFSIDSSADAHIYVGNKVMSPYSTSATVSLAKGQSVTILFMTWSKSAATYNFYITVGEYSGIVVPTALVIPGDTVAVLNGSNNYYYLSATITTSGTYTLTLTGDVDKLGYAFIYYGTENDSEKLTADNNYTFSYYYAVGDTISVYVDIDSETEGTVALTLISKIESSGSEDTVVVTLAYKESYGNYYMYFTATSTYDLTTAVDYVTVNGTQQWTEVTLNGDGTYAFKVYVGDLTLESYTFNWYYNGSVVATATYTPAA